MPGITYPALDELVGRQTTTETTIRMASGPGAPRVARQHVRNGLRADLSPGRVCDLVLLTSELVTNAVEASELRPLDLTVVRDDRFTRVEVSNPKETWSRAPEPHSPEPDQTGGWGLFLVEQLSDRWGTSDADCTVWFEFDHRRAETNPGLVEITAEVCERCGFSRTPCEPHSCIEEKALFSDSVNAVMETFARFDESAATRAMSDDLRSGEDRREVSMTLHAADERRRPSLRRRRRRDDL